MIITTSCIQISYVCVNLAGGGVRPSGPLFMCRYLKLFPLIRMIILLAIRSKFSTVRQIGYNLILFHYQAIVTLSMTNRQIGFKYTDIQFKIRMSKASKSLKSEPNYADTRSKTHDTRSGIDELFQRSFRSESCAALFQQSSAVL